MSQDPLRVTQLTLICYDGEPLKPTVAAQ